MSEQSQRQNNSVEEQDGVSGSNADENGESICASSPAHEDTKFLDSSINLQKNSETSVSENSMKSKRKTSLKIPRRNSKSNHKHFTEDDTVAAGEYSHEDGWLNPEALTSSNEDGEFEKRERSDSMLKKIRNLSQKLGLTKPQKRESSSKLGCGLGDEAQEDGSTSFAEDGNSKLDQEVNCAELTHRSECSASVNDIAEGNKNMQSIEVSERLENCCCPGYCQHTSNKSDCQNSKEVSVPVTPYCALNIEPNVPVTPYSALDIEPNVPVTPYSALDIEPNFPFHMDSQAACGDSSDNPDHDHTGQTAEAEQDLQLNEDSGTDSETHHNSFFRTCWRELYQVGWYWGPLTLQETSDILHDKPRGSFLVRDSTNYMYILSLSYRTYRGATRHMRIQYNNGYFSLGSRERCASVKELIERVQADPPNLHTGRPVYPFQLLHPVMRSEVVPSLQYLCRLAIRWSVWSEDIDELPLPRLMLLYLKKRNHFIED